MSFKFAKINPHTKNPGLLELPFESQASSHSKFFGAKINFNLKKVVFSCGLFLAILFGLFCLVNLDLNPIQKVSSKSSSLPIVPASVDVELKKRLGSTTFSMESYADWAKVSGLDASNNGLDADPDSDGLPNYLEYIYGTNPLQADSDGDGYSDKQEITNGFDPDAPGSAKPAVEIVISKINVEAPMIWSKNADEKSMLSDLENGLSHYPNTATPGQNGNMIVSGHSSNYVWAKGDYNHIFKNLNDLEKGNLIIVKTSQANGRIIAYSYRVSDKFVT